jgi:nitrogen fixation/metabolism regulation signal transduction histidine kinase
MTLTPSGSALLGLTALVAVLVSVITFALLRFMAAASETRRQTRSGGAETALLSAALQEAVNKLKAQERATAARADASERLSGEIITSLTAGLLVIGMGGDVRILNPAGLRVLDRPESLKPDGFQWRPREQPLLDVIAECLRDHSSIVRREIVLPGDGHAGTSLGVSVSPLVDPDGRPQGAICLFTDLTAIKDLEEQLRLKESLATVGELTAGIAHEFRNGLATIQGYSKLFDLGALPEQYRPYVQGIRAETESLSQVVTNFLNFARPAQLTLTDVDLGAICRRAADEFRPEARALGGDIAVTGEFGVIDGDEVLLRQAFSNLLRNAVEACAGAAVPPRVTVHSERDVSLKVWRISVTDNGPGVAEANRERVFQPFFTMKRNGTGLGLALVQKIIVFHNGRTAVVAASKGGASFQITLPLGQRPSSAAS